MDKFAFSPSRGFEDAASFPDPTTEAQTRKQLMTPSNQLANYINDTVVPKVSSLDSTSQSLVSEVATHDKEIESIKGATGDEDAINQIINGITKGGFIVTEQTVFNINGISFKMSVTES